MNPYRFAVLPIVLIAALGSAVVTLADGINRLYLVQLSKTYEEPTAAPSPQPTATPGAGGSCDRFLNAATLSGQFNFTYVGSGHSVIPGVGDLTASVNRTFLGPISFSDRTAFTNGNGTLEHVEWTTDYSQIGVTIVDSFSITDGNGTTVVNATGGTIHPGIGYGYLTLYADTCTYDLSLWPEVDQTFGGTAIYDSPFRFLASAVPVHSTTSLTENVQARAYNNDQYTGSDSPSYQADLGTTSTTTGNNVAKWLLWAQTGTTPVQGQLNGTAGASWTLSPTP